MPDEGVHFPSQIDPRRLTPVDAAGVAVRMPVNFHMPVRADDRRRALP